MNKYSMYGICLMLCLSSIVSCDNKSTGPVQYHPTEYFPNQVGMWWSYKVVDRDGEMTEMVKVVVAEETTLDGDRPAMTWVYHHYDRIDTSYVCVENDTVKFFDSRAADPLYTFYLIPLEIGNSWDGNAPTNDTFEVVGVGSVSVPRGTFENTYQVDRSWNIFENAGTISTWIAPGAGIIRQRESGLSNYSGSYYRDWVLMGYEINP